MSTGLSLAFISTQTSLGIIAICMLIATLSIVAVAVGILVIICTFKRMVARKIDEVMNRVEPIVSDAKAIAEQARETAEKVSEKVDSIMTKADDTAGKVASRMDTVTATIAQAICPQAPAIAGYANAALKVYQLFQQFASTKHAAKSSTEKEGE